MAHGPILIVAEKERQIAYSALTLPGEQVEYLPTSTPLATLRARAADLLLLDCGSDAEQGLQLLTDLKRVQPSSPIIFLTEKSSEEIAIAAFQGGARIYLKKPVNPAELQNVVNELLSLKRGVGEHREKLNGENGGSNGGLFGENSPLRICDMPERLFRAIQYVERNLSRSINLNSLADVACLSKFHFSRTFKEYSGLSPMQFVASRRIAKAKQLLQRVDLTIATVALRVGYNDVNDFIRQFKKLTGKTPSQFREARHDHEPGHSSP